MPINPAKTRPTTPLVIVDVIKVLASQLIVLHHFVSYGSMAKTVYPYATHMFDWLYNDGRMAVQAFLLLGGFFAATRCQRRWCKSCVDCALGYLWNRPSTD